MIGQSCDDQMPGKACYRSDCVSVLFGDSHLQYDVTRGGVGGRSLQTFMFPCSELITPGSTH